jgi:glycosyltransferase involved in cell wall biosynthesis
MKSFSLVIPCFNEGKNIPMLLERCQELIVDKSIEIIIVDNGSTDDTDKVLKKLILDRSSIRVVHIKINQGYGYGILEGLKAGKGKILAWTHADLQTDLRDVINAMEYFKNTNKPEQLFVKGSRYGRPIIDIAFTIGMSIFETILMKTKMWDINAQPTVFHRSFYESWENPPKDFSLDLFAYFMAKKQNLTIKRFPVLFADRVHGSSHWNVSVSAKFRFIKRTLHYSFLLNKRFKDNA